MFRSLCRKTTIVTRLVGSDLWKKTIFSTHRVQPTLFEDCDKYLAIHIFKIQSQCRHALQWTKYSTQPGLPANFDVYQARILTNSLTNWRSFFFLPEWREERRSRQSCRSTSSGGCSCGKKRNLKLPEKRKIWTWTICRVLPILWKFCSFEVGEEECRLFPQQRLPDKDIFDFGLASNSPWLIRITFPCHDEEFLHFV